jgi:tetrahydromethanopterin S-methyltransferase subunit E
MANPTNQGVDKINTKQLTLLLELLCLLSLSFVPFYVMWIGALLSAMIWRTVASAHLMDRFQTKPSGFMQPIILWNIVLPQLRMDLSILVHTTITFMP